MYKMFSNYVFKFSLVASTYFLMYKNTPKKQILIKQGAKAKYKYLGVLQQSEPFYKFGSTIPRIKKTKKIIKNTDPIARNVNLIYFFQLLTKVVALFIKYMHSQKYSRKLSVNIIIIWLSNFFRKVQFNQLLIDVTRASKSMPIRASVQLTFLQAR